MSVGKRRAGKAQASGQWIRTEKRAAIYERDGWACAYCGRGPRDARRCVAAPTSPGRAKRVGENRMADLYAFEHIDPNPAYRCMHAERRTRRGAAIILNRAIRAGTVHPTHANFCSMPCPSCSRMLHSIEADVAADRQRGLEV